MEQPRVPGRYYHQVGVEEGLPTQPPDRPLRVLQVIKCLGHGGAERLLVDMVAAADPQQMHYEVAYVLRRQNALVPQILAGGTPVYPLDAANNADLRWMSALRRLLMRRTYDVVHFHLPYAAALGQLVVSSLPRPARPGVVYTEHSLWDRARLVNRALVRASMVRGERVVAVSQASYEHLPPPLRRRATTVVHGVDLSQADALVTRREELRSALRAELGAPDEELVFITVANLRPEKGYDVLLDAAHAAVELGVPVRFAAVGRGPLRDEMLARHAGLGLGERFVFLGQRDDVLELLAGADAFVLASRWEGLPVALMEATSVGLPVIASAIGGVPQVLEDETDALLVPPGDVSALVDAVVRMASDAGLRQRLGRRAKQRSAMFDITEACRAVGDVYRQVAPAR